MAQALPAGQVTFAFTDVVGSTRSFTDHGPAYVNALPAIHRTVAEVTEAFGGAVVKTEGDGAFLAFPDAGQAVRALCEIQERLEQRPAESLWLRIRAGAHTGAAEPVDGDYLALAVHIAARVSSAAGAGQVLVSDSVVEGLDAVSRKDIHPVAVGVFELKDIREPMQLWRVAGDDASPRATPASSYKRRPRPLQLRGQGTGARRARPTPRHSRSGDDRGTRRRGQDQVGQRVRRAERPRSRRRDLDGRARASSEPRPGLSSGGATLGLSGSPTTVAVAFELARRGHPLLILDNCEHVPDTVAELTAAPAAVPGALSRGYEQGSPRGARRACSASLASRGVRAEIWRGSRSRRR